LYIVVNTLVVLVYSVIAKLLRFCALNGICILGGEKSALPGYALCTTESLRATFM